MEFQKQDVVTQSKTEVEFIAANATVNQAIWIRKILVDFTEIFVGNRAEN